MKSTGWPSTSRHERGYGSAWDKLRLDILRRDCGLCQCPQCKAHGRVTIAREVHHIRSKAGGGTDDPGNLQAISRECHMRETAAAQGRMLKPRPVIGADGFPTEGRGGSIPSRLAE